MLKIYSIIILNEIRRRRKHRRVIVGDSGSVANNSPWRTDLWQQQDRKNVPQPWLPRKLPHLQWFWLRRMQRQRTFVLLFDTPERIYEITWNLWQQAQIVICYFVGNGRPFHPKNPEGKAAVCGEVLLWKYGAGSENTKGNIS